MRPRRVVLVGFMASGKTAVGEALADALGWTHIDLDTEVERAQGRTVAEIFAAEGEPYFRDLEAGVTRRFISREDAVISTGGGWVKHHRLSELGTDTLSVWLDVEAEEVLRRVQASGGAASRPLLAGDEPDTAVRRLLAERRPLYAAAEVRVETNGREVDEIANEIEMIVRSREPVPSRF